MIYAENIFICLVAPLCVALVFTRGKTRRFCGFFITGIFVCLLAAYINSYLVTMTGYSVRTSVICVTPICEELMKLLPILFYFLVFEPDDDRLIIAAVAIGVGFATFENGCYMMDAGAADFTDIMVRGFAVGIMHTMCTLAVAGMLVLFGRYHRLMPVVIIGVLAAAVTYHAIYNMLVSVPGAPQIIGYILPIATMAAALIVKKIMALTITADHRPDPAD